MRTWRKVVVDLVLAGAVIGAGYGYMDANQVAPSSAGQGSGSVTVHFLPTGHQVTSITSTPIDMP